MTVTESPSALLERAAAALESCAAKATPGPWVAASAFDIHRVRSLTPAEGSDDVAYDITNPADADWIQALGPSVASPLVEWLRHSATSVREHDEDAVANGEPGCYCPNEEQALTFARLVLGEAEKTP